MNLIIIQARMGSSRLPGKVLMDIEGKLLLERLISRIAPRKNEADLIIATTTLPEDDAIEQFCKSHGVACYRGSDWDVLDRFYQAAQQYHPLPDHIIRICADNPLHSGKVVDFVVDQYFASGAEYCSNSNHEPNYLEDGFDTEVFSYNALEKAWKEAKLLSDREHVCPYIKKTVKCLWKKAHPEYQFKLSVDTIMDLNAVRTIFRELENKPDFSIEEVVQLLKRKPEILEINKESEINSGLKKSLNEDRIVK